MSLTTHDRTAEILTRLRSGNEIQAPDISSWIPPEIVAEPQVTAPLPVRTIECPALDISISFSSDAQPLASQQDTACRLMGAADEYRRASQELEFQLLKGIRYGQCVERALIEGAPVSGYSADAVLETCLQNAEEKRAAVLDNKSVQIKLPDFSRPFNVPSGATLDPQVETMKLEEYHGLLYEMILGMLDNFFQKETTINCLERSAVLVLNNQTYARSNPFVTIMRTCEEEAQER